MWGIKIEEEKTKTQKRKEKAKREAKNQRWWPLRNNGNNSTTRFWMSKFASAMTSLDQTVFNVDYLNLF